MNALAILSLISDLYAQIQAQQEQIGALRAELAERDEPTGPPEP